MDFISANEEPGIARCCEGMKQSQLPLYGRYHRHSPGRVIENRTPDNRFGGTTPPEADF